MTELGCSPSVASNLFETNIDDSVETNLAGVPQEYAWASAANRRQDYAHTVAMAMAWTVGRRLMALEQPTEVARGAFYVGCEAGEPWAWVHALPARLWVGLHNLRSGRGALSFAEKELFFGKKGRRGAPDVPGLFDLVPEGMVIAEMLHRGVSPLRFAAPQADLEGEDGEEYEPVWSEYPVSALPDYGERDLAEGRRLEAEAEALALSRTTVTIAPGLLYTESGNGLATEDNLQVVVTPKGCGSE